MRKSVLGLSAAVAALALLMGGMNTVPETTEEGTYKTGEAKAVTYPGESEHELVKAAEFPKEGDMIIIEDEGVPLAASLPEAEPKAVEAKEAEAIEPVVIKPEETAKPVEPQVAETTAAEQKTDLPDLGGGVHGYYDDEAAEALLAQINIMRDSGKATSALSAELNDVARRRALTCVKDFSHNGMETSAECMAVGQQDAAAVVTSWYASDEHRSYISDQAYTQAGVACIRYDKGGGELQTIWILVLN